ncbi:MAG: glycoside hydrolase family 28 protein [Acidobacteriaceae bacterium]|nr:glycoside hydrolase family 28 protein [Acidobacteriaceae bacterium]
MYRVALLFSSACLGVMAAPSAGPAVFDVTKFGAVGDGTTLNSSAINKAIDAANGAGGGRVYFPAGTWLSGSIHLKSNVTLYLEQGATILASSDPQAYDPAEPNQWDKFQDFGHSHFRNSLIWGEGLENIAILGTGRIYGKGLTRSERQPNLGNKAISLKLCRNVTLKDFSILQGGWFGILATGVDNMTIDNVKIDTNRDGMDIDSCRNVHISNCSVNSPYDDGICLKADYALGFFRDDENITITNCSVSGYDTGTFLDGSYQRKLFDKPNSPGPTGRIKFGTESSGGFKNITISNSTFDDCRGLALETVDGGHLEDVTISNVTMRDIANSPIFLRLGARLRSPEGTPVGYLRRVNISNFIVYNADPRYGSIISGIPGHDIDDLKLNNIRIYYKGGGTKEDAALQPAEDEKGYPEPRMFGQIPAYGFFIRHVKGLEMNGIEVSYMKDDFRPAFLLQDVSEAEFDRVKGEHAAGVPTLILKNVQGFRVRNSPFTPDTQLQTVTAQQF